MSRIVFQGLQSCFDSQLSEQRTLRLRIGPMKPPSSQLLELDVKFSPKTDVTSEHTEEKCQNVQFRSDNDSGSRGVSQAFSSYFSCGKEAPINKEHSYIHPQSSKLSSLSPRSLELCTESLGSETGCELIAENCNGGLVTHASTSLDPGYSKSSLMKEHPKQHQSLGASKKNCLRSFPPPLTTLSGPERLRIRPLRDGGRVIMKAVVAPTTHPYLQVERSHGRLRLGYVKNVYAHENDSFEETVATECEDDESIEREGFDDNKVDDQEEQPEEEAEVCDACLKEDLDDVTLDFGIQMGIEEFQRPSRCKGECPRNENVLKWESHWVAT